MKTSIEISWHVRCPQAHFRKTILYLHINSPRSQPHKCQPYRVLTKSSSSFMGWAHTAAIKCALFARRSKTLHFLLQPHLPIVLILPRHLRTRAEGQIQDKSSVVFVFLVRVWWIYESFVLWKYILLMYCHILSTRRVEVLFLYRLFFVALCWYHKQIR